MGIYVDQPYRIIITVSDTLTGATLPRIEYKKPLGTEGYWSATISGQTIYRDITATENNEYGDWKFQASIIPYGDTERVPCNTVVKSIEKRFK
ncbi:MAG: hypothetical protein KJ556_21950 [Gammaproteobacteria bacterium]|nr:hypothetical protein [Gammaproteobacteria bacterium]